MLTGKKLIFVDDDAILLSNYLQLFTTAGYNVRCVTNRADLLTEIEAFKPDLLLLDIMLGNENGINILLELKRNPAYADLFVILFSGVFTPHDQEEVAFSLGADGMIKRPITNHELLLQVKAYIRYKEAIESFRNSETQLRAIIDNNPDVVLVINTTGIIVYANPSAEHFFGIPPHKLTGTLTTVPYKDETIQTFTTVKTNGVPSYGEFKKIEIAWEKQPAYLITIHDITEKKLTEERLKQSERIFTHAVDMLCIAGLDGYFKAVNPSFSRVLGYTEEEILSRPWLSFVHPDDLDATNNVLSEIEDGMNVQSFTNRYICKDGNIKWLSWKSHIYQDEGIIFAVARDVTEVHNVNSALRESEETFKRLFYDHHACQMIINPETLEIVSFNQAALDFYRYTAEDFRKLTVPDINPGSRDYINSIVQSICKGIPRQFQTQHITADKKTKEVEVFACVITVHNKALIHVIVYDVTKEVQARKQLHIFSRAIEQNRSSIIITDSEGNIIYVNPGFTVLTGYSADEVMGKTPRILKSGQHNQNYYKALWNTITSGKVFEWEVINKKKNGDFFWAKETVTPLFSPEGAITNYVGITEDITETKRIKEELRSSEQRFRSVWESAVEGMRLIDANGVVVDANPSFARLFARPVEQIRGKIFTELYLNITESQLSKFKSSFETKSISQFMERQVTLWNGETKWFSVSNSFVSSESGKTLMLSIFSDVTQTRQLINDLTEARDKAEEVNRIKSFFLANMSHELRTPFIGIMGYSEMLTEIAKDPEVAKAAEFILKSSQRLAQTLNKILTLSNIEFEKPDLHFNEVDVSQLVQETCKLYKASADKKKINLFYTGLDTPILINTEEKFLREIIDNLISNAVKFTDQGSIDVRLSVEGTDNKVLFFSVKDTGIGIPEDKQDLIWQEFRQVSEGLSRAYEGTGLGLTLTKKYLSFLGGKISLESTPGFGSEFKVELPLHPPTGNASKPKETEPSTPEVQNKRLLYVEDDNAALELMKLIFRKIHHLDTADSAQQALQLISENQYDALLVDINLGLQMSGLSFIQAINTMPGYKHIPKIAVTAYATPEQKEDFLSNGFTHYIAKPFFRKEIIRLVQTALMESTHNV